MTDSVEFYWIDDLIYHTQNGIVSKIGEEGMTVNEADKFLIGGRVARFQCIFNDWSKIFANIDMYSADKQLHLLWRINFCKMALVVSDSKW